MIFIVLIVALVFVACTAETATRTVSSRPTTEPTIASSPTPTRPPVPTRTPTPTRTPFPTLTPSPTPTFDELFELTQEIAYDDLFRNNELHVGKEVRFVAKIVQVIENPDRGDEFYLRGNVTPGDFLWDDAVFLEYTGPRLLEDDIVEMIGIVEGLFTYEAVLGNQVTVPHILVVKSRRIMESGNPSLAPTPTPTSVPVLQLPTRVPASSGATITPTPTQMPSPAPTPIPPIGGMDNPVPFGETMEIKNEDPGEDVETDDHWEITVVDVIPSAFDQILQENLFNEPPKENSQFFMVKVKVKYLGPGSNSFDGEDRLRSVGDRRVVYSWPENICGIIPDELPGNEMFTEGEIEGHVCWEVEVSDLNSLVMFVEPYSNWEDHPRVWFSLNGGSDLPTDVEMTPEESDPTDVSATPSSSSNSGTPEANATPIATGTTEAGSLVLPTPQSSEPDLNTNLVIVSVENPDIRLIDSYNRMILADALGIPESELPEVESGVKLVAEFDTGDAPVVVQNSGFYTLELAAVAPSVGDFPSIKTEDELRLFGRVAPDGAFQELTGTVAFIDTVLDSGGVESMPKISIGVSVPAFRTIEIEMLAYSSVHRIDVLVSASPTAESSPVALLEVFGDGYWEVGTDIAPGLYVSPGGTECKWQRLGRAVRGVSTIIEDGGGVNPRVIIWPDEGAFVTQGCEEWQPVASVAKLVDVFGDGIWLVGEELRAGTYHTPGGERCYWARLSGFDDKFADFIESSWPGGPDTVEIKHDDVGFQTYDCGEWTRSE